MRLRFWIPALILLLASSAFPADDVATDAESFSGIYVKAADSEYDWDTQTFHAAGDAVLRYDDMMLTANTVDGNASTGDFEATGNVVFTQGERTVKGEKFVYNYKTKLGRSTDASAGVDKILFHGDEMDSDPTGYALHGSTFTTCDKENPHYYLAARELIIKPGDKLIARDVRLVALGKTLFRLPKYTTSLKEGEKKGPKLPSIGLSGKYGSYIGHSMDFTTGPNLAGELSVRLSTRDAFQGGVKLSQTTQNPLYINLAYREPYYGGRTSDTLLSRLPEVAYRVYSKGDSPAGGRGDESLYLSRSVLDPTDGFDQRGGVHYIAEAGIGSFKEEPSRVNATRMDLRATAWLDGYRVGDTMLVPGALVRFSHYSTGDNYSALGFRLAAARKLGAHSYASLTYLTHAIGGTTPFDFDPIEIPQELAGRVLFPVGDFAIGLGARYDLQRRYMFDSEISISRTLHCVEPTLTWRNRFREFSFGIGLVGF